MPPCRSLELRVGQSGSAPRLRSDRAEAGGAAAGRARRQPELRWHGARRRPLDAAGLAIRGERARHLVSGLARVAARVPDAPRCGQRRLRPHGARPGRDARGAPDLDFSAQGVVAKLTDGPSAAVRRRSAALLSLTHAADRWTVERPPRARAARRPPRSGLRVRRELARRRLGLAGTARRGASYLRAEALLPLAGLMPQKECATGCASSRPPASGWICGFARARGTVERSLATADASAKFRDVGFAPLGRAPGLRGLSGVDRRRREAAATLEIDTQSAVFHWPGQFPSRSI